MREFIPSFLIFWPLVAGLAIALWPVRDSRVFVRAALVACAIEALLDLMLLAVTQLGFGLPGGAQVGGAQYEIDHLLLPVVGLRYHLTVDTANVVLGLVAGFGGLVSVCLERKRHFSRVVAALAVASVGASSGCAFTHRGSHISYVFLGLFLAILFALISSIPWSKPAVGDGH